jgi:hypothetical protein
MDNLGRACTSFDVEVKVSDEAGNASQRKIRIDGGVPTAEVAASAKPGSMLVPEKR